MKKKIFFLLSVFILKILGSEDSAHSQLSWIFINAKPYQVEKRVKEYVNNLQKSIRKAAQASAPKPINHYMLITINTVPYRIPMSVYNLIENMKTEIYYFEHYFNDANDRVKNYINLLRSEVMHLENEGKLAKCCISNTFSSISIDETEYPINEVVGIMITGLVNKTKRLCAESTNL